MVLLIINTSYKEDRTFTDPIVKIIKKTGLDYDLSHWSEYIEREKMEEYPAIIISASPRGDNANFNERLRAFPWLIKYEKPVFGICAGHQLTGVIFGSKLIKDKEAEEGPVKVKILKNDLIFKGLNEEFFTKQMHNDSITLPKGFELLATSENCTVQAMRHKTRPIYTVQWHTELSNPEILQNFILNHKIPQPY